MRMSLPTGGDAHTRVESEAALSLGHDANGIEVQFGDLGKFGVLSGDGQDRIGQGFDVGGLLPSNAL